MKNRKNNKENKWTQSWFFEKINDFDTPLPRMTKKIREKTQLTKLRNESRYHYWPHGNRKDYKGIL